MARAAAIILQNDSVAMIERNRAGQIYYFFPGGQIEEGESQKDTIVREVKEELGLDVKVGNLLAKVIFNARSQFHFLAEIMGGEFGTGNGDEMLGKVPSAYGTYSPVWVPVNELKNRDVRPRVVAELIEKSSKVGWPTEPIVTDDSS